jgi:hypothetical protein
MQTHLVPLLKPTNGDKRVSQQELHPKNRIKKKKRITTLLSTNREPTEESVY